MKKFLLLIDGMSGAGKTTTSKYLADEIPRTAIIGFDKIKKFISDFERSVRDNTIARNVTFVMAEKYLDLGLSVIVEQPFKTEKEIIAYEKLANDHNASFFKYQLWTDPNIALQRVIERTKENNGDLPKERAERNITLFESHKHLGFVIIDTADQPLSYAAKIIMKDLHQPSGWPNT